MTLTASWWMCADRFTDGARDGWHLHQETRDAARSCTAWKNLSGFNDDWKLSTAWVQSLGGKAEYDEVKGKFVEIYWGKNGKGKVAREKWLLPRASLRRLAKPRRTRDFYRARVGPRLITRWTAARSREFFRQIVTAEDVSRQSPIPKGCSKS